MAEISLRELAEADLADTLEGEWSLPVVLIDPDGVKQTKSANDPEKDLSGQVLYSKTIFDPATGGDVVVNKPVVTLRVTSLDRVPLDTDDNWGCQIPIKPNRSAPKKTFRIGRPIEGGPEHGEIRLYLEEVVQAPA